MTDWNTTFHLDIWARGGRALLSKTVPGAVVLSRDTAVECCELSAAVQSVTVSPDLMSVSVQCEMSRLDEFSFYSLDDLERDVNALVKVGWSLDMRH